MNKKAFSFAELIISILIFAVLLGVATFGIQSWMKTSRDTARATDLNEISNALQIYLKNNEQYPMPYSGAVIYASGTSNIAFYQGYIDSELCKNIGIDNKKDPLTDELYTYSINYPKNKFELLAFFEKDSQILSYQNKVYAETIGKNNLGLKGDKIGIFLDTQFVPIQKYMTGLDMLNTNNVYQVYFDKNDSISGTGKTLTFFVGNQNKEMAKYDTGLVFYSDMETTIISGGLTVLKDLSAYGNNGICYDSSTAGNCGSVGPQFVQGKIGKGMQFNGLNNYVLLNNSVSLNIDASSTPLSIVAFIQSPNYARSNYVVLKTSQYTLWFASPGVERMADARGIGLSTATSLSGTNFFMVSSIKTISPSTVKLYINKDLAGQGIEGTWGTGTNSNSIYIGYGGPSFSGTIDEVRIYNRALSDDEIKAIYDSTN